MTIEQRIERLFAKLEKLKADYEKARLARSAVADVSDLMADDIPWQKYGTGIRKLRREVKSIDRAAGRGVKVGRTLSFEVADSYADYIIVGINRLNVVVRQFDPHDPSYSFAGIYKNSRGQLVLPRPVAENRLKWEDKEYA